MDTPSPRPYAAKPTALTMSGGALLLALAGVPFLVLLVQMYRFGFTFPYWDEMLVAPLVVKARLGSLSLLDLWAQQNEHRLLFPRLVMIAVGLAFRWNGAWVLACSVACGVGVFLLFSWSALASGIRRAWWAIPVFAFWVFSWAQMENWVWGLELMFFMCNLAVAGGIMALTRKPESWRGFIVALLMGVVASYSFSNGLLYWFAAVPMLFAAPGMRRETRVLRILIWALVAAIVLQSYLIGYHKPGVSPSLSMVLYHPLTYAGYLVLYLGSPVTAIFSTPPWHGGQAHAVSWWQFLPGLVGMAAIPVLLWRLWRIPRVSFAALAPWLSVAAFAFGSALITAWGRAGFGLGQALSSRYITTSMLFWCALTGLLAVWWANHPAPWPTSPAMRRGLGAVGVGLLLLLPFLAVHSNRPWEDIARWKKMGWEAVAAGHEARLYLLDLWGGEDDFVGPDRIRKDFLPLLREHGLCGVGAPDKRGPEHAPAYLEEARYFAAQSMWIPAITYLETAEFFDPENAAALAMRQEIPEAAWQRYAAYNAPAPSGPAEPKTP